MSGIADIFDGARDEFTLWSPLLWDRVGAATVAAAGIRAGEQVLDACCGAGAAALPAARAVGGQGRVDAVDFAAALVDEGRRRGADLRQLRFHVADVLEWAGGPYDAVLCVFGVFFLPDMDSGGAHLARLLRPGGRFAVTTWERGCVERLVGPFATAAAAEHEAAGGRLPAPAKSRTASARVDTAAGLAGWLAGLGLAEARTESVRFPVALDDDLAWTFVTGAGPRAMLAGLGPEAVERVRERYLAALAAAGIDEFPVAALVGIGHPTALPD